jgi:anti-anti-sigma factor
MNLKIEKRQVDGVNIVSCEGRVMFGEEANALRDFLKQSLSETPRMVLNLSGVTYIDSGGLGTLRSCGRGRNQAHRSGPAPARCAADYQAGNGFSGF